MREQQMRLYIFRGVPMDTHFEPRTRKEISKIQWYKLSELPTLKKQKQHQEGRGEDLALNANKFYMVAPFMVPLKKWIAHRKKAGKLHGPSQPSAAPVALDDNIATSEDQAFHTGNLDILPSADDLGGVMAKLRQPERVRPLSDLPEVLNIPLSTQDASTHLKNLLRVAPGLSVQSATPPVSHVSATPNPSDLLALLQPAGPADRESHSPMTLDKVAELPLAPLSTNPEHTEQENGSRLPPSSGFSTHLVQASSGPAMPYSASLSNDSMTRLPKQPNLHQDYPHNTHVSEQAVGNDVHQSYPDHQMLPPYQRTGDPDFARNSQIPNIHQLLVPSADNLPRPKLNTHSSALLNLFKNAKASESKPLDVAPVIKIDVDRHPIVGKQLSNVQSNGNHPHDYKPTLPSMHLPSGSVQEPVPNENLASKPPPMNDNKNVQRHHVFARPKEVPVIEESRPSLPRLPTSESSNQAQIRSKHQGALLDLFRNPVVEAVTPVEDLKQPSTTFTTQTLEPPTLLAELSALPSPAHSREPSQVDTKPPALMSQNTTDGLSKTTDKPRGASRSSKPPVSATVNGPLNVPQFDVLAKTAREVKSKAPNKHTVPPNQSPVTIISRQVRARDPLSLVKQKQPVRSDEPLEMPSSVHTNPRFLALNPIVTDPKPTLYPQILRRPAQVLASLETSAAPSPIQPLPSPKQNLSFDHRQNQTKEQKQALLSLFGKPSPPVSPAISKLVDVISPLSGRNSVQQTQSPAAPPTIARSRMGSLTSGTGEASIRTGNGRKTPRTTAVDKSFLLGYLEGVANGERR